MLRESKGARRFNDLITLTLTSAVTDEFGHTSYGAPVDVMDVYAQVRQMSATKTLMTFQQADAVGVDIEMRAPHVTFNGARWRGHKIEFPTAEDIDNRGMYVKISGWYQVDTPRG